jgi:carnosine N-methyltransferase
LAGLPGQARFSMVAGDFLEVYTEPEYESSQDAVVTCFFLDCVHNVLDFLVLIPRVLKPSGHWINLGPLLYHFADIPKEESVEPPWEVVRGLIEDASFDFVREQEDMRATYVQNPASMLQFEYRCVFFSAVKKDKS